jgi:hypothetical protein
MGSKMSLYRLPFDTESGWFVSNGNWDSGGHLATDPGREGQLYAFDVEHKSDATGRQVRAIRAGVVVAFANDLTENTSAWTQADWDKIPDADQPRVGGGNHVLVRHGDDTVASYAHLLGNQNFVTRQWQWVFQGQVIGKADNTGSSWGPHLHFDVRLFWNTAQDLGPSLPLEFGDHNQSNGRPRPGDTLSPKNTILRQDYWRFCDRCHGLFYGGYHGSLPSGSPNGVCPKGGAHEGRTSGNYVLSVPPVPSVHVQPDWRSCSKCQGLFFGGHTGSRCPADGKEHNRSSGQYALAHQDPSAVGQKGWRWCNDCEGLFFGVQGSVCPAAPTKGGPHTAERSGDYTLELVAGEQAQRNWRFCGKCKMLSFGGSSASSCPAGGEHLSAGGEYVLIHDMGGAPGDAGWRWCLKCQGLHWPGSTKSVCARDGKRHETTPSGDYRLVKNAPTAPGQQDWARCAKCAGLYFKGQTPSVCKGGGQHSPASADEYVLIGANSPT